LWNNLTDLEKLGKITCKAKAVGIAKGASAVVTVKPMAAKRVPLAAKNR